MDTQNTLDQLHQLKPKEMAQAYRALLAMPVHEQLPLHQTIARRDFHMPQRHRIYLETRGWEQEYFLKKAAFTGTHFKEAIVHVLNSRRFTEQSFNACLGLLRMESKYGKERLEKASAWPCPDWHLYASISTILQVETPVAKMPRHKNIGGNKTLSVQRKPNILS